MPTATSSAAVNGAVRRRATEPVITPKATCWANNGDDTRSPASTSSSCVVAVSTSATSASFVPGAD